MALVILYIRSSDEVCVQWMISALRLPCTAFAETKVICVVVCQVGLPKARFVSKWTATAKRKHIFCNQKHYHGYNLKMGHFIRHNQFVRDRTHGKLMIYTLKNQDAFDLSPPLGWGSRFKIKNNRVIPILRYNCKNSHYNYYRGDSHYNYKMFFYNRNSDTWKDT